mmetsp:Transcript_24354/g.41256  ORF Transcript_24354/g.41256 Transcript_24354/m.41256 type:complete len:86 (-) Transcript_24354:547-804(-)
MIYHTLARRTVRMREMWTRSDGREKDTDKGPRRTLPNAHMYPYVHVVDLGRAKAMGKAQGKVQGNPALDHPPMAREQVELRNVRE